MTTFTDRERKGLQRVMQDPAWSAVEAFLQNFIEQNFPNQSVKRDSNFETIWQAAYLEGGKDYLDRFFIEMEYEARKAQ